MTAVPIPTFFVRADGGEVRERRAELACDVVHAEIRAIEAQFFSGYRELDRLQKGIGRRADVGVRRWCPVPEGEKADPFHARHLREKAAPTRWSMAANPNNSPLMRGG